MKDRTAYELIQVPNRLKAKVSYTESRSVEEVEAQVAEELEGLKDQAQSWFESELAKLAELVTVSQGDGDLPSGAFEQSYHILHNIKSLAATFALPQMSDIAEIYCRFWTTDKETAARRPDILSAHVDALRAAFHAPDSEAASTAMVIQALEAAVDKALAAP